MIRFSIYFVALAMGACGLVYEYNFSKLSSDLLGNSEKQWAWVIGLMMFAMGLGAEYQKRITDRHLIYKFAYLEIILSALGGWGPILLFWVFGSSREYYALVQFILIFAVGFIIGMEIPLLTRMNEQFIKSLKINIGGIISRDYVGAFIGTIIWVFVLVGNHSIFQISILTALFNLMACFLITLTITRLEKSNRWQKNLIFSLFVLMCPALSFTYLYSPKLEGRLEQNLFSDPIIFSKTTKYQHIVLTRSRAGEVFCYINGNLQFSSFDEHIYHEYLVHPAMHLAPRKKNILILGGGDGLALREVLKYPQVKKVTLIDIDPVMTELASKNKIFLKLNKGSLSNKKVQSIYPPKDSFSEIKKIPVYLQNRAVKINGEKKGDIVTYVEVFNIDAQQFLENVPGYYDVIIIDFPDPNSVNLAKLYSKSFYSQVKRRLQPTGIIVQQSTSPYLAKEAFLCIGRTWQQAEFAVVPVHANVPSFGEWGWWLGGDQSYYSEEKIKERLRAIIELEVNTSFIYPQLMEKSLLFGKNMLKSKYSDYNTILNNTVYEYYELSIKHFR